MKITIDGPAGSGKSTVAKLLADKLNFLYIDSGSLYRAFAWALGEAEVTDYFINQFEVDYNWQNKAAILKIDGRDISKEIRDEIISNRASSVARLKKVRDLITSLQKKIADDHDVVLEGRDAGTVVFPRAESKFFLTASVFERAKRRVLELEKRGENVNFEQVKADILERDHKDTTRNVSPLKKAEGAIEIDTDGKTINEVVDILERKVKEI